MRSQFNIETIRLVIFDWDGTLMDSELQIVNAMQGAISDLNLEARTHDACKDIIGLGLKEAIERLYPGSDEHLLQQIVERYRHHWLNDEKGSELFPGATDTLYRLKGAGYQLAVATGKARNGLNKVLDKTQLHDIFAATRCADETRSKPHPQMLEELMDELNVKPQQAIMVGDTEYDLQMANQAGVGAVGVTYGVHEVARLLACNPLVCLDQIDHLQDWLFGDNETPIDNSTIL